jgi:hypothetical protein
VARHLVSITINIYDKRSLMALRFEYLNNV